MAAFVATPAAAPPTAVDPTAGATPDAALPPATAPVAPHERVEQVRRGDTLMTVLIRAGVEVAQAAEAIKALRGVFDPRGLKPGQQVKVRFRRVSATDDPDFSGLSLQASIERDVLLRRDASGYHPSEVARPLSYELARGGAIIDTSLFRAGTGADVPVEIMLELIRMFSYDVDFQRDVQPGDFFEVLYERWRDAEGRVVRVGHIEFAALNLSGDTLRLYRFRPSDSADADYFNDAGESVRKALLRTPVDGAKLTSGFGLRLHPLLGFSRMHQGVDFGAPYGSPIMAAGDGTIDRAGPNGGYGNYIKIRHNGEFSTAYAHLSRFGAGIRPGVHVHQGQVIGYIGATGLATGPHLHFEVLRNDHQINPQSVKFPTGRKLDGVELRRFRTAILEIDRKMQRLPDPFPVAAAAPHAPELR